MKHLHEINGRWAVRIVVPVNLRGIVGRRELREWLGSDKTVAKRSAPGVVARFYAEIDDANAKLAGATPTIRTAAQHHYAHELQADDHARASGGAQRLAQLNALTQPHRAMLMRLLAAGQLASGEAEALMGDAADDALAAGKADPATDRRALLEALSEVQLEAMARIEDRDHGRVATPEPKSEWLQPEEPAPAPALKRRTGNRGDGKALSELVLDFHRERSAGKGSLSPKTMSEHIVAVRMLKEFLGGPVPAAGITKDDLLDYKRALMDLPSNYRLRFPGKTLPEAIALNKKLKTPHRTLDPQTINNKWLSHIGTIMQWCEENRHIDLNPARRVKIAEGKGHREPTRVPFSQDDLKRIFGSELFADPKSYGTKQWALLVALYTGARSSSEIARIKLADIFVEQGVPVVYLEEASKNRQSKRLVPIHQALIDRGFMAYVEKLRKAGKVRLFPDWDPEDKINRWFLRTYKAQVGINDTT